MDELWRPNERFIAICAGCSREGLKRNMHAIYIKAKGDMQVKVLCHICDRCLPQLMDKMEISMPG